jgi:hypothetical protein
MRSRDIEHQVIAMSPGTDHVGRDPSSSLPSMQSTNTQPSFEAVNALFFIGSLRSQSEILLRFKHSALASVLLIEHGLQINPIRSDDLSAVLSESLALAKQGAAPPAFVRLS